jgi:hypothetical protein
MKGIGKADEMILAFEITGMQVEVECRNNGGQSYPAQGVPHFDLSELYVEDLIDQDAITKNGSATQDICLTESDLDAVIIPKLDALNASGDICKENNWYWDQDIGYIVSGFSGYVMLLDADGSMVQKFFVAWPNDEDCYDVEITEVVVIK